jgi:hypothetical protein
MAGAGRQGYEATLAKEEVPSKDEAAHQKTEAPKQTSNGPTGAD